MSFLLDTCVLSELTRPTPDPRVSAWLDDQDAASLHLSVLTVGEIEKGVAALSRGRKKRSLTTWLATLRSTYADRLLQIDVAVAAIWGRTAASVERRGRRLGVVDGLIAATALHHGLTVVTRNVADFAATGAALLNPWES
jgi:predicted nucleic acid-binding protein